jgi:hypothetical protein
MSSWKIVYLFGGVIWLMFSLRDAVKFLLSGGLTVSSALTTIERRYALVMMFWSYVCASTLWPGTALLYLVAKLIPPHED